MKLSLTVCVIISVCHGISAQTVDVIDTTELMKIINEKSPKTKIINFWATWCKPCVQEIPYLETVNETGKADVVLVSLDFVQDLDVKVAAFINDYDITSRVCLLNNLDYNSWINRVDETWTGTIPATLIINSESGKRKFIQNPLYPGDLDHWLIELDN